jgi:hypothetical protein
MGQIVQDGLGVMFIEAVVDEPVLENGVDGGVPVLPADFLPLAVIPAGVADGHLKDHAVALGNLGGDLWFNPKAVGAQGDGLEHIGPKSLVAGLHIGEVQAGGYVGQVGKELVAQSMVVVEDAAHGAGREARAIDHIPVALLDGLELSGQFGQGLIHHLPDRPEGMVLGHSSFEGKVTEHGLLLHIVTAHNRFLRITHCYL